MNADERVEIRVERERQKTKDKVVAVVQARMGSTRLPNKMMLWLNGYPVIEWVRKRLWRCSGLNGIVFAIPWTPENDPLAHYLKSKCEKVYRGHETNVLTRMVEAARIYRADIVVRVCADNPFVSSEAVLPLMEQARVEASRTEMHLLAHWYISTNGRNDWADGLGAEVVHFETLIWAWRHAVFSYMKGYDNREHVLNYVIGAVRRNAAREVVIEPPEDLAWDTLKLDLDTYEDYQRLLASGVDIDMTAAEIVECFV
jgi:spore coat polysaccharide biosynthesis protein SpsF